MQENHQVLGGSKEGVAIEKRNHQRYNGSGLASHKQRIRGGIKQEKRGKPFITHRLEWQGAYRVCAKGAQAGNLWENQKWHWKYLEEAVRVERGRKLGSVSGSHSNAGPYSAENQCAGLTGISDGKKQVDDV